ncbi:uncharacterized protein BX663DRAFT_522044 [Cokeromyces recurvatus]|uniref:uncharacterized protein n=1 Tax=Cokeromyces recurvatus TaxID=90255 RepID=UPI00221F3373|nr:uncharacterized protein BX663DRAFT_522044 [Cokeromyces recurvatus]KAI7899273.1 hypothetical protein BX663DRAFT_522044 [Cokeromyces recurvatus]
MSTFSKNLFDVLGDGEIPRPEKEEKPQEVVVDKKNVSKISKDASRANRVNKGRQNGRQRGRQFDRHSGTGIVDTQKKINKGWGKPGQSEAEAAKDAPEAPEAEAAAAPVEEQEKVKTLDEYLAEKANKSLKVSLPEARKANDDDASAFEGAVVVSKQEVEEYYVGQVAQPKKSKSQTTEKAPRKVFVEIEQRFQEKPRSDFRNNRRNGGGRRNGGNRRGGNGKKNAAAPVINLQDASAFPTLGATA